MLQRHPKLGFAAPVLYRTTGWATDITVGSNGLRAMYGSTVIPLGQNASLGLAFENVQGGRWRAR